MGDFIESLISVFIFLLYLLLLPAILILATPIIFLWPARKMTAGMRGKKNIPARYKKVLSLWKNLGLSMP